MPAKPPRRARRAAGRAAAGRAAFGALLAAALLTAAGHALLWLWACGRLEAGLAAWADARRAEGWRVEHGPPSRGGWPFAAALAVPGFRLRGEAGGALPVGVDWRAEAPVALRVSPPRFDRLAVEAPGRHRLGLGGETLSFTAEHLGLALPLEGGAAPPREAAAAARGLRFDTPAGPAEIRAASLGFGADGGAAALRASAADLVLPDGSPGAARLGRAVERIGLDLLLTGPAPPPGPDPARRAAAWRDSGGELKIRALDARWGETAASATATLVLDGALQPAGTGALRVTGGDALLDAAAGAGLLPPFGAAAARVALRALSRPPPGGGAAQAEAPLALRNRSLAFAGVPLARLPAFDWGAPGPGSGPTRRAD